LREAATALLGATKGLFVLVDLNVLLQVSFLDKRFSAARHLAYKSLNLLVDQLMLILVVCFWKPLIAIAAAMLHSRRGNESKRHHGNRKFARLLRGIVRIGKARSPWGSRPRGEGEIRGRYRSRHRGAGVRGGSRRRYRYAAVWGRSRRRYHDTARWYRSRGYLLRGRFCGDLLRGRSCGHLHGTNTLRSGHRGNFFP